MVFEVIQLLFNCLEVINLTFYIIFVKYTLIDHHSIYKCNENSQKFFQLL